LHAPGGRFKGRALRHGGAALSSFPRSASRADALAAHGSDDVARVPPAQPRCHPPRTATPRAAPHRTAPHRTACRTYRAHISRLCSCCYDVALVPVLVPVLAPRIGCG